MGAMNMDNILMVHNVMIATLMVASLNQNAILGSVRVTVMHSVKYLI
jgi:hypothetical protein